MSNAQYLALLAASGPATGSIIPHGAGTTPTGYLPCDGAAVSRTTYAALFAVIGVQWGAGDGFNTFNVPDIRGRVVGGIGTGSGLTARTLTQKVGEETHVLLAAEMAAHSHAVTELVTAVSAAAGNSSAQGTNQNGDGVTATDVVGADAAHNIMQPTVFCNYIIKT